MAPTKIFITDVGIISALGLGFEKISEALSQNPHTASVKDYEFHQFEKEIPAYLLRDYDPEIVLGKKGLRLKDHSTKLILGTFETGFKSVMESADEANRPGICIGTTFGSVQSIGDFLSDSIVNGVGNVNPQAFANTVINAPTGQANIRFLARNLSATISTGFNAGIDALIYTFNYLKRGYLQSVVAGGLEEVSYYSLLGFMRAGILASEAPAKPFSASSKGVVMGEGCALLLLETEESVKTRGAKVVAEIIGTGSTFDSDAAQSGVSNGEAGRQAIIVACKEAGISPDQIDFVASGASGNPVADKFEAKAIALALGSTVPVTAYKRFTGECYGASGAINTLCALSDMKNNRISGIGENYTTLDGINVVFSTIQKGSTYALVTSFACDGNCSALIIKNVN
jgi:3-oxoacyl-[acyl-carrier-protein] synthase II